MTSARTRALLSAWDAIVTRALARLPEARRRDMHQFRLLSRDARRQVIDTMLVSRDADPMQFALWLLALVATPPLVFAGRQALAYNGMVDAPSAVIEQLALGHRLFFVSYSMLAAALFAALSWEALFPDGRDQEVIGTLPVRPAVYAAARLGAAIRLALVVGAVVNVPPAVFYTLLSAAHPMLVRHAPGLLIGHIVSTVLAALLVFLSLLVVRGVTAIVLGARAGAWLGAALQLFTVVAMFEAFFFLPGILGGLASAISNGDPRAALFPPVWYVAVHGWVAASSGPMPAGVVWPAFAGVAALAMVVVPLYLLPARWLGRRALETRTRHRTRRLGSVANRIATIAKVAPSVRGMVVFALASLLRSRRHLLVIATYVGVAIAVAVASVLLLKVRGTFALDVPAAWGLALPLVFQFFLVIGIRAAFRIPTEIDANWPFRLTNPRIADAVRAVRLAALVLAVVPTVLVTVAVTTPVWAWRDVVLTAILQALGGCVLVEWAFVGWTKIPFACGHVPSPDVLKSSWPLYTIAMYLYAFQLSDWQVAALHSPRLFALYIAAAVAAIAVLQAVRHVRLQQQLLEFDVPQDSSAGQLRLSGALN